jgi:hypothetical protein
VPDPFASKEVKNPKPGPAPLTPPGRDKMTPVTLEMPVPVAPAYLPLPPVITAELLPTSGNGGVPEEKSMHVVSAVSWVYKRSPLG